MSNEVQGTPEWLSDRLGWVSASRMADVMAKTKSGEAATRKNYMMQLLCERLTDKVEETYTSPAMQRGTDLEPVARSLFEMQSGLTVKETKFIRHPNGLKIGASPDGLCSDGSVLEIKCPNTAQFVDFWLTGKIPRNYELQMRLQMACADASHAWFVMYDDRMPSHMQLKYKRLERDFDDEEIMIDEAIIFLNELDNLIEKLQDKQ